MMKVSVHDFQREVDCVYDDEKYTVRDNGAVFRHSRTGNRPRPTDSKWVFGKPNSQNGYMYISQKRMKKGVNLINPDYKDQMAENSERIFFKADSLSGSGSRDMAKKYYNDLIKNYPYTKEGAEAYRAIAMLYSDEGAYKKAVQAYRNYLLVSESKDEWCKVYFMIGYTYGENLAKLDLAAENYRWVLKNQPSCDLVSDAEFMYLHLGEAMVDIEELQAENARQGRNQLK